MKTFKDCQGNVLKVGDKVVYFTKYRNHQAAKGSRFQQKYSLDHMRNGVIEAFTDCMTVVRYTENRTVAPFKTKLVTVTSSVYSDKSLLLNN